MRGRDSPRRRAPRPAVLVLIPPGGVAEAQGEQDGEEEPGSGAVVVNYCVSGQLSAVAINSGQLKEGAGQVLLAELAAAPGEGLQARQLREEEVIADICEGC